MTDTIPVTDDTAQALRAVRRELPETEDREDAIQKLAHEFARRSDHLRVQLSGRIKHAEQVEQEEGEA